MRAFYLVLTGSLLGFSSLASCVSDTITPQPDASNDAVTAGDNTTAPDSANDASSDVPVEAAPPPCGAPGEDCCVAPLAPCEDGLTCSTGSPKKCLVSEAWAAGEYTCVTSTAFVHEIVTAHYDGSTWSLGPSRTVKVNFGLNSYYPVDIYQVGTNVRVLANENNVGQMYWWNGVSWAQCKPGNSCVGPQPGVSMWALTSVTNSGSTEFWLTGSNLMFRCPSGATSCPQQTGVPGTWGSGNFAGQTAQDLYYSVFDHLLHYDGTTWTSIAVADARTIADVGKDDMWVGDQQLRHWNGTAWSSAYLVDGAKTPGYIFSISGSGGSDVHAVGNSSGASFAAHWDGTGWKLTTLPSGIADVQKVWAPSKLEAFTVGSKSPNGNKGVIAHWNGTAWSEMTSPTVSYTGETSPGTLQWYSVTGQARPRRAK